MKLSTRSRYGLIAVVDLALAYGEGPVSLATLANTQGVSESYLEQLLRTLKSQGIVETVRGASGGYVLRDDPKTLSVGRVLEVLEGGTAVVDCVGTGEGGGLHLFCTAAVSQIAGTDRRCFELNQCLGTCKRQY